MAALLRQGVRRIGGSPLQRTQAAVTSPAVAEEPCRLVARRMLSTGERAPEEIMRDIQRKQQELADAIAEGRRSLVASTKWRHNQHPPRAKLSAREEIHHMKEELYEALSQVENRRNRRLLMALAVDVYPRQQNIQWHRLRVSTWTTNVVRLVGIVLLAFMCATGLNWFKSKVKSVVAEKRRIDELLKPNK